MLLLSTNMFGFSTQNLYLKHVWGLSLLWCVGYFWLNRCGWFNRRRTGRSTTRNNPNLSVKTVHCTIYLHIHNPFTCRRWPMDEWVKLILPPINFYLLQTVELGFQFQISTKCNIILKKVPLHNINSILNTFHWDNMDMDNTKQTLLTPSLAKTLNPHVSSRYYIFMCSVIVIWEYKFDQFMRFEHFSRIKTTWMYVLVINEYTNII